MAKINEKVIDISYAQQNVDFEKVKNSGITNVIIRNGYLGKTDTFFDQNVKAAIKYGFNIGTYTYIMSNNVEEAKKEAQETIKRLEPYKGYINFPVFCDMEDQKYSKKDTKFSNRLRTDIVKTFCTEIDKAGYFVGIYTNPAWLISFLNKDELINKYDIWLAHWTYDSNKPSSYNFNQTMWQWGLMEVDGIKGKVDANIVYIDYPSKIKSLKKNFLSDTSIISNSNNEEEYDVTYENGVWQSYGMAAIRNKPNRTDSVIKERCQKDKYYLIDGIIDINGERWLRHATGGYSMYKDKNILFRRIKCFKYFIVTAKALNVRQKNNISSSSLGILKANDRIGVVGLKGDWYQIIYKHGLAWVNKNYVKEYIEK